MSQQECNPAEYYQTQGSEITLDSDMKRKQKKKAQT
jgi:hypothetical protein